MRFYISSPFFKIWINKSNFLEHTVHLNLIHVIFLNNANLLFLNFFHSWGLHLIDYTLDTKYVHFFVSQIVLNVPIYFHFDSDLSQAFLSTSLHDLTHLFISLIWLILEASNLRAIAVI